MTTLQKKLSKFLWTAKSTECFQNLKQIFMNPLVLRMTCPNGDLIVSMDARNDGLGGFLLQNNHVICYESQKLKKHE